MDEELDFLLNEASDYDFSFEIPEEHQKTLTSEELQEKVGNILCDDNGIDLERIISEN